MRAHELKPLDETRRLETVFVRPWLMEPDFWKAHRRVDEEPLQDEVDERLNDFSFYRGVANALFITLMLFLLAAGIVLYAV